MKLKFFIDTHKGLTFLFVLGLIAWYGQWNNPTAWVYLALHGTYGLLWVLKSRIFPDQSWEKKTSLGFGLVTWVALTTYLVPAWLIIWRNVQTPPWLLALAVSLYTFGVFFHFASDMQKHTSLKFHPNRLITDGMMALSRNINYFGEFLIYSAFALLAVTPWAFLPLGLFIIFYWIPNMRRKERMLAQMEGYAEYRARTKVFIPFIF